jgi:NAD(P)-dependent dehydrogenase (short-subunit alcohol dehydrogenase family)
MSTEKWDADNIPEQKGRIAVVTGASSGIGFEAARVLASKGAQVMIAVRSLEKGNAAADKIRRQNPNADVKVMELDLANLESVEKFAETFRNSYSRLDLLINNAGVMIPPYSKTADGFELQFGTNHLGHFALTGALLELLTGTKDARVVNVASGAHNVGNLNFDDLQWEKRSYSSWRAYGDSKISNLYFTYELNKKLKENGLDTIAVAAHPGYTATELQRHVSFIAFLNNFFAQDVSMGALPTLRAATEKNLKGGEYFGPGGFMEMWGQPVEVQSNKLSKDEEIAKKLWEVSENLTGVKFDFDKKTVSVGK